MFYLKHMSSDEPEIIEIGDLGSPQVSTNFGPGIELLMNDKMKDGKKKSNSSNDDIGIEDITDLEKELNDLTEETININVEPMDTNIVTNDPVDEPQNLKVSFDNMEEPNINLGKASSENATENKTWDGYAQFNDIPLKPEVEVSTTPKLSKEEMLREKFKYLRKLEQLEKKGVELTKRYSMESSLTEMMGEYEMIMNEKEKENSIKFQGNMLSACINGIEFLNGKFDPFDINLDGWGEQFNENVSDYDEIFGELHEKYKSKAKMAPELKLVFQLAASGMMVHMTNTMFKSAMPNMDDVMRQNPDLMQQFQTAAVDSMGKTNPGFSGFMNNMMNPEPESESKNVRVGPPPAPVATNIRAPNSVEPPRRPGFVDGNPFGNKHQSDGISMEESFEDINRSQKSLRSSRPEMKGPSNIEDILSGLKPKGPSISPPNTSSKFPNARTNMFEKSDEPKDIDETGSTISISDLKDLQSEGSGPKRSKRRQKSDKNTISLDI